MSMKKVEIKRLNKGARNVSIVADKLLKVRRGHVSDFELLFVSSTHSLLGMTAEPYSFIVHVVKIGKTFPADFKVLDIVNNSVIIYSQKS